MSVIVAASAAVAAPPAADAQVSLIRCSAKGLYFQKSNDYFTESVKVRALKAHNRAKCRKARAIARVVAKRLLARRAVPAVIKGYAVKVKRPCSGCAPVHRVRAVKGVKRVTFRVHGGA